MQHLNERNVFTKTITIIQIMNEMCTWTNLVHRTNIGISPLHDLEVFLTYTTVYIAFKCSCDVMYVHVVLVQGAAPK